MRINLAVALAALAITTSCAQSEPQVTKGGIAVEELAAGLDHPWGMAFLPDGRLLVTEREGRLRILGLDRKLSGPLEGVPEVRASGQGGLLDVALDPDFKTNRTIYLSFAEAGGEGGSTALAKAKLGEDRVENARVIFRQLPKVAGAGHFGGRIVFSPDGRHLFLTTGDRQKLAPAQDLQSHLGKVIRLNKDGTVPPDNPFVGRADAKPEIWSYGNRQTLDDRVRPRRRRRVEPPRARKELRLAVGQLGRSLQRHRDSETIDPPRPRRCGQILETRDQPFGHDLLHGEPVRDVEE